jgi:polyhydroxybutyrate depolymerase
VVDDAAYLDTLIAEVKAEYNVDPKRVFLFGISNGGFMAYRMACDHAGDIAAMVSVVGAGLVRTKCNPSEPVSVLEIHGTADEMVPYDGGEFRPGHPFPGTEQTVADWADMNACDAGLTATSERRDLDSTLSGAESVVSRFDGCPPGTAVELWAVQGAGHQLHITPGLVPAAVDFLLAHGKP